MLTATSDQLKVGRQGTVSMRMTAADVLTLAVNVANGWSLNDLGFGSAENTAALGMMLAEVHELVLQANRAAVEKRLEKRTRQQGARGSLIITPEELERQWTSTR